MAKFGMKVAVCLFTVTLPIYSVLGAYRTRVSVIQGRCHNDGHQIPDLKTLQLEDPCENWQCLQSGDRSGFIIITTCQQLSRKLLCRLRGPVGGKFPYCCERPTCMP
uniref:Single domain-containing protein n=1 Tax=Amblyomma maculatum TaxID=34609 RepID=G3MSJ6_AMBMU